MEKYRQKFFSFGQLCSSSLELKKTFKVTVGLPRVKGKFNSQLVFEAEKLFRIREFCISKNLEKNFALRGRLDYRLVVPARNTRHQLIAYVLFFLSLHLEKTYAWSHGTRTVVINLAKYVRLRRGSNQRRRGQSDIQLAERVPVWPP